MILKTLALAAALATCVVAQTPPAVSPLTATPAALAFTYQIGSATLPASQTLNVASTPTGQTFPVAVSGSPFNAAWLLVSASTGKAPATIKAQVNPTSLAAGTYSATITIAGTTGSPPPNAKVTVTLQVASAAPTLAASPATLNFTY